MDEGPEDLAVTLEAVALEAGTLEAVADALRTLALDERMKERVAADPALHAIAYRVARRYIAGDTVADAIREVAKINLRGDDATVDFMGESCRDVAQAQAETDAFVQLSDHLAAAGSRIAEEPLRLLQAVLDATGPKVTG